MYSNSTRYADTIANEWAHNTDQQGYKSKNSMFYRGYTIYSYGYHFPIATKHTTKRGENIVLMTTQGYSSTTSKHIHAVHMAISHKTVVNCYNPKDSSEGHHNGTFKDITTDIENAIRKLLKARKPEIYTEQLQSLHSDFSEYVYYLGVLKKDIPNKLKKYAKLIASEDYEGLKDTMRKTVKKEAKQRAERAKANAKRAAELKERSIQRYYSVVEEFNSSAPVMVQEFKSFQRDSCYIDRPYRPEGAEERKLSFDYDRNTAFLRYNAVTEEVETSKGVSIPLREANRLFNWLTDVVSKGGCTDCREVVNHQFNVDSVTDTHVKIGCHTISIKECKEVMDTIAHLEYAIQYSDVICAKLAENEAKNLEDAELARCLEKCVLGSKLIEYAKVLRNANLLKL